MKTMIKKLREASSGFAVAFGLSFLLFVYAPLDLYLTNTDDFWMTGKNMFLPILLLFVACFFGCSVMFIIARKINKKLYGLCLAGGFAILVSTYIQGTFLIKNLPSMDGSKVDWNAYPAERIASIIAFAVPICIMLFILIKFKTELVKKITLVGGICLSLLFAVSLVSLIITAPEKTEILSSTTKNEFELSSDKNLIVLVLDATDSDYFKAQMEKDEKLSEMLDGFTYYDNAISTHAFTKRSLPMIFSGEWNDNEAEVGEYRVNSLKNSPFLNYLQKENYKTGIYEEYDIGIQKEVFDGRFENCTTSEFDLTDFHTYTFIMRMAGVKFFPWDLKREAWGVMTQATKVKSLSNDTEIFSWSDLTFYNELKDSNPITVTDEKCARIIHLEGAHVPLKYDKDFNVYKKEDGTYEGNVDACITLLKAYISRLKESGVYDNSAIAILADHGWSGDLATDDEHPEKRVHPLLMTKGINENHELEYSTAPISYTDIADGITKLASGSKGNDIFDYSDGETRTRKILLNKFGSDEEYEYLTDGYAGDTDAMKKTGTMYKLK